MKKLFPFILFSFYFPSFLFTQTCIPNSITLGSQKGIDNFSSNYPGCTEILGSLTISNSTPGDPITNFNGLSHLRKVGGNLIIEKNLDKNLGTGFNSLDTVKGEVYINLQEIPELNMMNNLKYVGDLKIVACNAMTKLSGFNSLTHIKNTLSINANHELLNIVAFNNLRSIGQDLKFYFNSRLSSITGFSNLKSIGNDLDFEGVPSLVTISGLNNLEIVHSILFLGLNRIKSLGELQNLRVDNKTDITIQSCDSLMELGNIFRNATSINNLLIANCDVLQELNNSKFKVVKGGIEIKASPLISNLELFNSVDTIYGKLELVDLNEFENISGFSSLKSVGSIAIAKFEKLKSISGLSSLNKVKGSISINLNPELYSLEGLENIDTSFLIKNTSGKKLTIFSNKKLQICNTICNLIALDESVKSISYNGSGCEDSREAWVNCDLHKCMTNGADFVNQESIDAFRSNNRYCEVIDGDVCIGNCNEQYLPGSITNLSGLSIDSIFGSLTIIGLPNVMPNEMIYLRAIRGKLEARDNELINFSGFSSGFSGSLILVNNGIIGFPTNAQNKISIGGNFIYENNRLQTELPRFSKLQYVYGSLIFSNNIDLKNMPDFEKAVTIYGNCIVSDNPKITSGINNNITEIKKVTGDIIFKNNPLANRLDFSSDTIFGNVEVSNNPKLSYFAFNGFPKILNGNLIIENNDIIQLNAFDSLRTINGNFRLKNCKAVVNLERLRYLGYINGFLDISNNSNLTSLNGLHMIKAESIKSKENQFDDITLENNALLSDCDFWNFCEIIKDPNRKIKISGNLKKCENIDSLINDCKVIECPSKLYLSNQTEINEFERFHYGCEVTDELEIKSGVLDKITSLKGLYWLKDIKEDFSLKNTYVKNFDGFQNIKRIGTDVFLIGNVVLDSYFGLNNLDSIDRINISDGNSSLKNFKDFPEVRVVNDLSLFNSDVYNFEGIEKLKKLNSLSSSFGEELSNLKGIENLKQIKNIRLSSNQKLYTIKDLDDLQILDYSSMFLSNNKNLSACNSRYVCRLLNYPTSTVAILNNGLGCTKKEDLTCDNYLAFGAVFFDTNKNGVKDEKEFGILNINFDVDNGTYKLLSDPDGRLRVFCDSGNVYTIQITDIENWELTTDFSSYTFTFDPLINLDTIYTFGLYPKEESHSIVSSIASPNVRCSEIIPYSVTYQNQGSFNEEGFIKVKYHDKLTFVSSIPSPAMIDSVNQILIYNFNDIFPYEKRNIKIDFKAPDFNSTGKVLDVTSMAYVKNEAGLLILNSENVYSAIVRCSYDPNDKQVNPIGINEENLTLFDSKLNYLIRFQNTGNDYAANIKLIDTLNENLDIRTFKLLESSHEVDVRIFGRIIEFVFNNINLPDSTANYTESNGYVSYSIQHLEGLEEETAITNKAEIYFDFNPPVVTNTTLNTMVSKLPTSINNTPHQIEIKLYPNPAKNELFLLENEYHIIKVEIHDIDSRTVLEYNPKNKIDISGLKNGLYLLKVTILENGIQKVAVDKFIVQR